MNEQIKAVKVCVFNPTIFFMKLDRVAAWVLLFVMLAYAVTGFGMTKGIIDQQLAQTLHFSWLAAIGLVAFIIHTYHAIDLAFKRWRIWNIFSRVALFLFYVAITTLFVYLQFFYSTSFEDRSEGSNAPIYQAATSSIANINADTSALPIYTAETLLDYNGLNGQPAYVAVDGLVYDLSRLFRNGNHQGHFAGQDLSSVFHGQHSSSILKVYKVVGTYK